MHRNTAANPATPSSLDLQFEELDEPIFAPGEIVPSGMEIHEANAQSDARDGDEVLVDEIAV